MAPVSCSMAGICSGRYAPPLLPHRHRPRPRPPTTITSSSSSSSSARRVCTSSPCLLRLLSRPHSALLLVGSSGRQHASWRALFGEFFRRRQKNNQSLELSNDHCYHSQVSVPFPEALLVTTFLADQELKCCYKASVDGFSATTFHEKCDFKGPCVIVGETDKRVRFGAFNPEGYRSTDDYYDSFEPFLFYWPLEPEDDEKAVVLLRKVGGSGAALFDYARGGPQFGADGLLIGPPLAPVMGGFSGPDTNSGVGILTEAKSRLGLSYAKRPDGKDSIFGDDRYATIIEIEVFCSPAIAKLY